MERLSDANVRSGQRLAERANRRRALVCGGLPMLWLIVFFLAPLGLIAVSSFLTAGPYGTVEWVWTSENYRRLMGFGLLGFDPLYLKVLVRSVLLGLGTALCCMLAGLPLAFFLAQLPAAWKTFGLTLVVIPFWTNLLIRTYAWQILLSPDGWLTRVAVFLGIAAPGDALYPSLTAVTLCMVCDFLPFMVLPLYASVEKMDWTLVEAAADLGAGRWNRFRFAMVPQIKSGVWAGLALVFLPATGQFVIPDLLGGGKTAMLGNAIQQQFGTSLDWPFGAAIAMVTLTMVLVGFGIAGFFGGKGDKLEIP